MNDTVTSFKSIIEQLDTNRPKVEEVEWETFDMILNNCDFTKTKNAFDSMKVFYENLWRHLIFPLRDELHITQRENGRLILEWDQERRKASRYKEQIESLQVGSTVQEDGGSDTKEV